MNDGNFGSRSSGGSNGGIDIRSVGNGCNGGKLFVVVRVVVTVEIVIEVIEVVLVVVVVVVTLSSGGGGVSRGEY